MGKAAVSIELTVPERRELGSLARPHRTVLAMARRAHILLAAATGLENQAICNGIGADANMVSKCPSSNHLRLLCALANGVSGPSVVEVKLPFGDASSGAAGWFCA
jgi:hypothetical protein